MANDRAVMGMEKVSAVAFTDAPSSQEAFFGTEPTASGSDAQERNWVQRGLAEFVARYREALDEYRKDPSTPFPQGTWWMKRYSNVDCYRYAASG